MIFSDDVNIYNKYNYYYIYSIICISTVYIYIYSYMSTMSLFENPVTEAFNLIKLNLLRVQVPDLALYLA